eukprot:SAG22_NODE_2263_length_2774_cov_6.118879_5_plen_73_part_00
MVVGSIWTREFENCSVRFDRTLGSCGSVSNVGCGTITIKTAESRNPRPGRPGRHGRPGHRGADLLLSRENYI